MSEDLNFKMEIPAEKLIEYGGFWIRFMAFLIDVLILMVFSGVLILFLDDAFGLRFILNFIVNTAYFALLESSSKQGTIGKQLMNLKVTDENFRRISLDKAIVRYVCKIPSSLILMIGFIMAAFDSRKQSLHDKLAKTLIIKY